MGEAEGLDLQAGQGRAHLVRAGPSSPGSGRDEGLDLQAGTKGSPGSGRAEGLDLQAVRLVRIAVKWAEYGAQWGELAPVSLPSPFRLPSIP